MRFIALALLGSAVLLTVGCSSSRSFSRTEVMADHIASVRPDGSHYVKNQTVATPAPTTTYARRAPASVVTYTSAPRTTARYSVPAPPPPPAMPSMSTVASRPAYSAPAAPVSARPVMARPAARAAAPTRRAPTTTTYCEPCPPNPCPPRKARKAGWKLFGGCVGGT